MPKNKYPQMKPHKRAAFYLQAARVFEYSKGELQGVIQEIANRIGMVHPSSKTYEIAEEMKEVQLFLKRDGSDNAFDNDKERQMACLLMWAMISPYNEDMTALRRKQLIETLEKVEKIGKIPNGGFRAKRHRKRPILGK